MCIRDRAYTYILYILVVIFIVTAVSNGANITDGLDGLATGVCAIIGIGLGIFAYVSAVSYTHLDVYKRQIECISHHQKSQTRI